MKSFECQSCGNRYKLNSRNDSPGFACLCGAFDFREVSSL